MSVSLINIGDPVISLKKIKKISSNGIVKKFDSTIWTKLNKDEILDYKVFDYNSDWKDDILLLENNGLLSLLENTNSSKKFLDQKHLARVVDFWKAENFNTWDFSWDWYDDIFFVNNKWKPFLFDNNKKDFVRVDLTDEFGLSWLILQAKTFDMDNDNITDIVTLDDNGEINIFYWKRNTNSFTKKLIHSWYWISLSNETRNDLWAVYYDWLTQRSDIDNVWSASDATGVLQVDIFESIMFEDITYDTWDASLDYITYENNVVDSNTISDLVDLENLDTNYTDHTTFIKSEFSDLAWLKVTKTFTDKNSWNLNSWDIVEVNVELKNIWSSTLRNIAYLEDTDKYFELDRSSIKTDKNLLWAIGKYEFHINEFNLLPGQTTSITYNLKTKVLSYSHIKVWIFENWEAWYDEFGDIIVSASKYNCGWSVDIFRSLSARSYLKWIIAEKCDESSLPEEIAESDIDVNDNGIPDYIDELQNDNDKLEDFKDEVYEDLGNPNETEEYKSIFERMWDLNQRVDEISYDLDSLIQWFWCGFGWWSCFWLPINWAPLAPWNDPVVMWMLMWDWLIVNEWYPVFSTITWWGSKCTPWVYPAKLMAPWCVIPWAWWALWATSPTNFFRLFATPTLTGWAWIAACYWAPAMTAWNIPPKGLNPVVPGWNCIVAAAPFPNLCEDEEIISDPSVMGPVDYYGSEWWDLWNSNWNWWADWWYWVINWNCSVNSSHEKLPVTNNIDTDLSSAYFDYRETGVYSDVLRDSIGESFSNPTWLWYAWWAILNEPLISINWWTLESSDISLSVDFAGSYSWINFRWVEELEMDRVAPFPYFITWWVNDQLEEFITKLADFPTLFIILPDFSGIFNADLWEYSKYLVNWTSDAYNSWVKKSDSLVKQSSWIKEAYEFLSNVPFVTIEWEPVNVSIPWPRDSIETTIVQRKLALDWYQWEINRALNSVDYDPEDIINAQEFMASLQMNLQILEWYKRLPEQIANLAWKKQDYLEQILCNINAIWEVTGWWLDRNWIRFKAWVELYVLIKAILKSWQLLADLFIDYDEECHECKNERYDSLWAQFEIVSMILPSLPVIEFPKWPDIVLDLHNIRLNLTVLLPQFEFTKRPLILPPAPSVILPKAPELFVNLPALPILPIVEIPELPDIPSLPTINLPDLPPPPTLPKLFANIEWFLNILKLITKAMCILKKSPFVPETRAWDQIAFLTESSGYRPFDFIHLLPPKTSYPVLDEIRVTTYVNLEFEVDFIAEMAKTMVEPVNQMSNDFIHMFDSVRINTIDLSDEIPSEIWVDLEAHNNDINSTVNSSEFLALVNKELSKESIIKDWKYDELRWSFDVVNNYTYSKENKLISKLKKSHYEKFDILESIIEKEITKQKEFKKNIWDLFNKTSYIKISNNDIDDIELYNTSLNKYNEAFKKSAKQLINPTYFDTEELKRGWDNILSNVKNTLNNYEKDVKNLTKDKPNNYLAQNTNTLYALDTPESFSTQSCAADTSNYQRIYEWIYILQKEWNKKVNYKLFDYLDDLIGDEITTEIDFDLDSDSDLLYSMFWDLYLKENLINTPSKNYISWITVLDSDDNKFINWDIYYEALNNTTESYITNEFININFLSFTRKEVNNYRLEYYNIIDKYLNEQNSLYIPDEVNKNIVDSFAWADEITLIENKLASDNTIFWSIQEIINNEQTYEEWIIKRSTLAYISEVWNNIPNVSLKTKKVINIWLNSLEWNNNYPVIWSWKKIYAWDKSVEFTYYETSTEELKELKIDSHTNVEFTHWIKIESIDWDLYIISNDDIILKGTEIHSYKWLPLSFWTKIINDWNWSYNSSSHIWIKYYDKSENNMDFRKIDSYSLYDLWYYSSNYSITLSVDNDYLYSRMQGFKNNIYWTKTSQVLLSPQKESDLSAPELNLNSITIPVYQEEIIDLSDWIYENLWYDNIVSLTIDWIDDDKYQLLKTSTKIRIKFGEFETLFKKEVKFILTDTNWNRSSTKVQFEVYSPIPEVNTYKNWKVSWIINENLTWEPINIYRFRWWIIKRLEDTNWITKVETETWKFDFDLNTLSSDLIDITNNGNQIFTVNEKTWKINISWVWYTIKVEEDSNNFVEISVLDIWNEVIFSQVIKLDSNENIFTVVDSFSNIKENGLYLRLTSSDFDYYTIPDSVWYNAWAISIYRKSDTSKEAIFSILPDWRIKWLSENYKLNYWFEWDYIVLNLIDINNNGEVLWKLLFKIDSSYVIK